MFDPILAPTRFEFDQPGRRAKISIPGVLETENEPIRNPVTGAPHRIQIVMPEGFEHHSAEVCSSLIESTGGIKFNVPQGPQWSRPLRASPPEELLALEARL